MQRNAVYNALLQQLVVGLLQVPPYNVLAVSRGFVPWELQEEQPAVFIVPKQERAEYKMGFPNKWFIALDLYVYVRWVDSIQQGVVLLAQIMDGIDLTLSPVGVNGSFNSAQAVNTLGGLATYCALQGEAEISGGFLNKQQTIARMPLEILVPG